MHEATGGALKIERALAGQFLLPRPQHDKGSVDSAGHLQKIADKGQH